MRDDGPSYAPLRKIKTTGFGGSTRLDSWIPSLPLRVMRVEHRSDGIAYYNKSRPVDQPFIATVSADGRWVIASFTRETGNVWSNPELTCQHVDPQTSLLPGQQASLEVKILVLHGSLGMRCSEQLLSESH